MSTQEMAQEVGYNQTYLEENVKSHYRAYHLKNFKTMPHINRLTGEQIFAIEVVGRVLPFRTNNYVTDELIHWDDIPNDPFFVLNFPQREMLKPAHFNKMASLLISGGGPRRINRLANIIRYELHPHPAGQLKDNRPKLHGEVLPGMQHKYHETVLFFPSQGQTCHAFCTFCFRWAQFVGIGNLKIAMKEASLLVEYLKEHPEVTDVLFTGGDPLIMKTRMIAEYVNALLDADLPNLQNIRIGSKALSYWPYRFLTDNDADDLLALFEKVNQSGKHLALMAHFSHYRELQTEAARLAISRIQETGSIIRSQSPVLNHINADPAIWARMWKEQVKLGVIPYYMFVPRDTGAQHYFSVPLEKAWNIFRQAYRQVSGLSRTVRGPVMSCHPGKVQILGTTRVKDEQVYVLRAIQSRKPEYVHRPFFAKYDPNAVWYTDLKPAFGEDQLFFE
jgi:KamA family protein